MLIIRQSAEISKLRQKIADFLHKCLFRLPNLHCSRFQATSNRVIPHSVGKCHVVTKGTGSRQELATNEVSRLRDLIGSLVKGDSPQCGEMSRSDKGDGLPSGAGRESTSGLRDYSGSLVKGDSPQCGEMSRSDKRRLPCKGSWL